MPGATRLAAAWRVLGASALRDEWITTLRSVTHASRCVSAARDVGSIPAFARAMASVGPAQTAGRQGGPLQHGYDYDLVVIGGGSGGLACAKEAARLGAKVTLFDFVVPTPRGTEWGLGGTCVSVGCIPKKLFHQAGLLGEGFADARALGWQLGKGSREAPSFDWGTMVSHVQDYISSLHFGYRVQLREQRVRYINARASFVDPHTVQGVDASGQVVETVTGDKILIAVGGRPRYLGIPGDHDLCITSDDLFSLPHAPGKTLVVGGSYIAVETAGFLTSMGYDVTMMVRSQLLRGFDRGIAEHLGSFMARHGTRVLRPAHPLGLEREAGGRVRVTYRLGKDAPTYVTASDSFDTVILAVGRQASTASLNLAAAGIEADAETGKVDAVHEQTSVPHVYAVGDVVRQRAELTPVAVMAGRRLARRLFGGEGEAGAVLEYDEVPTAVFAPLEYACVGMSEERAVERLGAENVEVYHAYFRPTEWAATHEERHGVPVREVNACYIKLITDLRRGERVLGAHYVGPNAGEVIQGMAVAMRAGATKAHFDDTIGIHPTCAEEFTTMEITKRSGKDPQRTGC